MKNKTILITGASSGIGYETALALAGMGAQVVFTMRDEAQGERTRRKIIELSGNAQVFPMFCRLDDFQSVVDFAAHFTARFPTLNVLIHNAGIWQTSRKESVNGIEMTLAVNHLAPFLLTHLLLPHLKKSAPARIIMVSSQAYKTGRIHFEDPEFKHAFPWMAAYSQSKLANLLFSGLLAEKLSTEGITVNCLHPGVVLTSIYRDMNPLLRLFFRLYMISPARGAQTSIYLASSPEVEGVTGRYFIKNKPVEVLPCGKDRDTARQLWELSLKYVAPWMPGDTIQTLSI